MYASFNFTEIALRDPNALCKLVLIQNTLDSKSDIAHSIQLYSENKVLDWGTWFNAVYDMEKSPAF